MSRRSSIGPSVVVLLAAGLLIFWRTVQFDPLGDEPHYLVLAHSIVHDGDFDISDDYRRDVYGEFYHAELDPHLFASDRRLSMHYPMLSLVVAGPYALFGREGATGLLVTFHLVAVVLAFAVVRALGLTEGLSAVLVLAYFFASPWGTMASQVYPDSFAIVCYAVLSYVLFAARPDRRSGYAAGIALAVLCSLHVKLVPAAIVFGAGTVAILRSRSFTRSCLLAFLFIVFANLLLLHRVYGSWLPWGLVTEDLMPGADALAYVHTAALYLFDPQYGLLPQAPGWLFVLAGLVSLVGERPNDERRGTHRGPKLWLCLVTVLVHFAAMSTWRWIGWSTSARYIAPVAPLALPIACLGVQLLIRTKPGRALCGLLLAGQVGWFVVLNLSWYARYDARAFVATRLGIERNQVPYFMDGLEPHAAAHPYASWLALLYVALGIFVVLLSLRIPSSGERRRSS